MRISDCSSDVCSSDLRLALGPSYGLYAVLDFIVDNLQPLAREFQDELSALEADIFAETYRRETIERLYQLKGELTKMRLAVSPLQDILSQLVRLHPNLTIGRASCRERVCQSV